MTMENYLSGFGDWVTVIIGSVFVVGVLAFRRGFVGEALAPGPATSASRSSAEDRHGCQVRGQRVAFVTGAAGGIGLPDRRRAGARRAPGWRSPTCDGAALARPRPRIGRGALEALAAPAT